LFAPWLIGVVREETGSFAGGLLSVAALSLLSLVVLIAIPIDKVRSDEYLQPASGT
jgi:MFS-type transporter involved in bile tolerance (Atg22 family)